MSSFSIVTPVYNGSRFLEATLLSVQAQVDVELEHLVVDDGSTDEGATVAILRRFPKVRWWTRPNRGENATFNEGLEAASGQWVLFLCADDLLAGPGVLRTVAESMHRHPEADVHYGRWMNIDADGCVSPVKPFCAPLPARWLRYVFFCSHCAMYVRRERLLERNIRFDPAFIYSGDVDWTLQLVAEDFRFRFVNKVLAHYRQHPAQLSRSNDQMKKVQLQRLYAKHRISPPIRRLTIRLLQMRMGLLMCMKRANRCQQGSAKKRS